MAARVFVSLADGRASSLAGALGGGERKKLSLALLPLPQSTLPAPYSSFPPSVFYSTSRFFFLFTPPLPTPTRLPLLCRRFDIGNAVSALHGNNSGKDDINYLPIV